MKLCAKLSWAVFWEGREHTQQRDPLLCQQGNQQSIKLHVPVRLPSPDVPLWYSIGWYGVDTSPNARGKLLFTPYHPMLYQRGRSGLGNQKQPLELRLPYFAVGPGTHWQYLEGLRFNSEVNLKFAANSTFSLITYRRSGNFRR